MNRANNNFDWRIGYLAFCLLFASWVVYLGLDNFDKVHGEYRHAKIRSQPVQVEKIARQQLVDKCRARLKRRDRYQSTNDQSSSALEDSCLSFPDTDIKQRINVVKEHLQVEKKRFLRKLIVFYISFGLFFLALPLYLLYLLLTFLVWVFRDIKILK